MSKTRRRGAIKNRRIVAQREQVKKIQRRTRKLQVECRCGKPGYPSEFVASDAVVTGGGRAGVRVYQCETGLWHTTNRDELWPRWMK